MSAYRWSLISSSSRTPEQAKPDPKPDLAKQERKHRRRLRLLQRLLVAAQLHAAGWKPKTSKPRVASPEKRTRRRLQLLQRYLIAAKLLARWRAKSRWGDAFTFSQAKAHERARLDERGVPLFRSSRGLLSEPWRSIDAAVGTFFGLPRDARKLEGRLDNENLFLETLARIYPKVENEPSTTPEELAAYAVGIAKNVLADSLELHERRLAVREHFAAIRKGSNRRARPTTGDTTGDVVASEHQHVIDTGAVEDAMLEALDAPDDKQPPVRLTTAFELKSFWDDVRGWCLVNLHQRRLHVGEIDRELSPQEVGAMLVNRRLLKAQEATWVRLLSMPACPDTYEVLSDAKPAYAYEREYGAVKKAIQRNRRLCPLKGTPNADYMVGEGNGASPGFSSGHRNGISNDTASQGKPGTADAA